MFILSLANSKCCRACNVNLQCNNESYERKQCKLQTANKRNCRTKFVFVVSLRLGHNKLVYNDIEIVFILFAIENHAEKSGTMDDIQ